MSTPTPAALATTPEERFAAAFEHLEGHTLNGTSALVQDRRKEAIGAFQALGLPSRKSEVYKYTNLEKVLRHDYAVRPADEAVVTPEQIEALLIPGLDAHRVVLVNGRYRPALSQVGDLPAGVVVTGFAQAAEQHPEVVEHHFGAYADVHEDPFTALNTAFTYDGVFVYVPRGKALEKPIHILHVYTSDDDLLVQPRGLFVAEDGAHARIVETGHALTGVKLFVNSVTEAYVGEKANVDHYRIQQEGENVSFVNTLEAYQEGSSFFSTDTITLAGDVVRNNLRFLPNGEHCETHLYGLFLGRGTMHVDNHTLVDHAQPNCVSNELFKGVLDDQSTGVFNGKVFVRQDAQQTNAYQSNKSIVLTGTARMYSKPELEIYADDVKCSHGATTGQLDKDAIFYLQARGIPAATARRMLLLAFARDVLEHIEIDALRTHLDALVEARFV